MRKLQSNIIATSNLLIASAYFSCEINYLASDKNYLVFDIYNKILNLSKLFFIINYNN